MIEVSGFRYLPGYFDRAAQERIVVDIENVLEKAPFFQPTMPRSGKPFSVQMSNCGDLGWVSDKLGGYRYQGHHPETEEPWPEMPQFALDLWNDVAEYASPPQACLINWYVGKAKMGLHQDKDEEDFFAPVVSVSLGDKARFRVGGKRRSDPTQSLELSSGDVVILGGEARLLYHGIDRIYENTSDILARGGRINLTLRRVTSA